MNMLTRTRRRAARPAFTLIELLVVIAVIILLVSITLVVGTSVVASAERRQTNAVLEMLDMAYQEWRTTADRQIRYGEENENFELVMLDDAEDDDARLTMDRFMAIISRPDAVKDVLARIDPSMIIDNDEPVEMWDGDPNPRPTVRVQDAWDTQIVVVHPGREWGMFNDDQDNYGDPDNDGTIRTPLEERLGVCVNARPAFVSAGPSGQFGDRSADPTSDEYEWAADNLTSYELEDPNVQ